MVKKVVIMQGVLVLMDLNRKREPKQSSLCMLSSVVVTPN